ncbi:MAG TPA: serine/threonine-protein kinase [Kofleriaceae bacterium]
MPHTPKPAEAGVSVGQVFLGKYRVDGILGHGGMGVVAECTHLALNERVAIKMLRQDVLMDQDAVSRFVREAQAAVKLKSEYVAKVHDVGTFENGVPYMAMEFLEGYDLGQLLEQRGVLPAPWAVELVVQTCEALAEAHSLSIVHRDVKPTNLFVTWRPDGSSLVKVLDFGISKSPMGTDMQLTQTQSLLGTPSYMSPEQMRSARLVDSRTDIWSLGTVLYEVLEGRRPFEAESFSEMCVKVAVDPPAPMINTPPGLQPVILRCLSKAPEQRYATVGELAHDLAPFSQDPHGANVMVERMTRMMRRSQGAFNDDAKSSPRIPNRIATPPPQWGVGSDPAVSPWQGRSEVGVAPYRPIEAPKPGFAQTQDASKPFAQPLPRKRRWVLALLGLALASAAATAVYVSQSGDDEDDQGTVVHAPTEVTPPPVAAPPQPAVVTPKVQQVAATPAPAPIPPPPATPPEEIAVKQAVKAPTPTPPVHKIATPAVTHVVHAPVMPKAATVKPEIKDETKPLPPPCDPFADIHGTECTKTH